jgi:choline dehydrogenase-like flavoprotein/nucleoside-diphosphate-sugar epimerase
MSQLEDLDDIPSTSPLQCDVCIVGSGPAGLALARALAATQLQVFVLESGKLSEDRRADQLGEIENHGHRRELDQTKVRNRIFGGSSHTWKGRCTTFADIDFEARDWVPNSGWPIGLPQLKPYFDEAARFLMLGPNIYDERLFHALGIPAPSPELDRQLLDTFFWQFSKNLEFPYGHPPYGPFQFGKEYLNAVPHNVRVLLNATVTHVNTNAEGTRLTDLEVSSLEGKRMVIATRVVVLCAGGIENARILLASNRIIPNGVGNAHDNVGRYLMDHLRVEVGDFAVSDYEALQDRFDLYRVKGPNGPRAYLQGFVLSPSLQRSEKLLHCAAWVEQTGAAADDPWHAARALLSRSNDRRLHDFRTVVSQPRFLGHGLWRSVRQHRGFRHKGGRLTLSCMCEQIPNHESRITLSARRDALGVPLSSIDWKVAELEVRTIIRTAEVVAEAFRRAGLPQVRLFDWVRTRNLADAPLIDVAHPTGTTRMSSHARDGVVDLDCKVHGVNGLYAVGSSVFPTAGHANPTLMLVALALRLGDHLKRELVTPRSATTTQLFDPTPSVAPSNTALKRVLVTGGTGRIGSVLVAELVRRGWRVRVVTSRPDLTITGVETAHMNWLESLDFAPVLAGCDAVLHLGAELHDEGKMERVNVEATRALAMAAEAAGVRFFGYASTVSVYGSPTSTVVTEETPVLEPDGGQYLAVPYLRKYASTKLAGERCLHEVARHVSYVAYRPTVVVDVDMLESMRDWSRADRVRYGQRRTNHVYVGDVVQAMIWLMERSLAAPGAGKVEVFNVSDESVAAPTYGKLYREAYRLTGDSRYRSPPALPPMYDLVRDALRYRSSVVHPRYPLGWLKFPATKLLDAGFQHPYGLDRFYRKAVEHLQHGARA